MVLCANIIPKERKVFLEHIGIECKELGIAFISEVAQKYKYSFIDETTSIESLKNESLITVLPDSVSEDEISVWIFQGNPQRYDILNALSDEKIGNSIHWLVNQHRKKIKKGHIGLIWMSGQDAGIYAITRINNDPKPMKENIPEKKYWINSSKEHDVTIRVEMSIIKKLINNPILKKNLIGINGIEKLSIMRQSQGTNFPVTNEEWRIIPNSKLIES